ncbi:hypothetical protein LJR045_000976 [Microbacterium sp. LjRoot45]|uniref:terminase large subunit domain-containing protein n=1 Tax=Microbacterium sp. LjRoot45 TaxID=3342329 RepID=UPI003ECD244F
MHEHDVATPETARNYGSAEPRICTLPLRELTPETSLGFEVIDFAFEVLNVVLLPWQRAALIRMLELNEDGSLRFRTVLVLVARQNGKSTLAQVLTIWLLFVWGWPLALGTAQDLDVAEALWEEVVDIVHEDEELRSLVAGVTKVNGKKSLNLTSGSKYKVKAANRRAGRGLSGNLVLLDELREHQSWDAWGAITKTTMARAEALILALSNAGDVTSRVLRYLRLMAHRALGDPDGIAAAEESNSSAPTSFDLESMEDFDEPFADDELDDYDDEGELALEDLEQDEDTLLILEWSAPPGCDRRDRVGWSWANPSRNYTISDRTIASAMRTDPEWVFRTEVLCQWNDGANSGPFDPGSWETTTIETFVDDEGKQRIAHPEVDRMVGDLYAGIAQAGSRVQTFIALAGRRPDGDAQVQIVTGRPGTDWVAEWLTAPERKGRIKAVTGQVKAAPESTLIKKLKQDQSFQVPIVDLQLLDAHADADDALRELRVWHTPWPILDLAAQTAERKYLAGGTWVLDPVNSPVEIAALRAWVAALWLLGQPVQEPPPPPPPPQTVNRDELDDDFDDGESIATVRF